METQRPPIDLDLHQPLPASLDFRFGVSVPLSSGALSAALQPVMASQAAVGVSGTVVGDASPVMSWDAAEGAQGSWDARTTQAVADMTGTFSFYVTGLLDVDASPSGWIQGFYGPAGTLAAKAESIAQFQGRSIQVVIGSAAQDMMAHPMMVGKQGCVSVFQAEVEAAPSWTGRQGAGGFWASGLPALAGMHADGEWDANAFRGPVAAPCVPFAGPRRVVAQPGIPWDYGARLRPDTVERWAEAGCAVNDMVARHRSLERYPVRTAAVHTEASPVSVVVGGPYVATYRRHQQRASGWTEGISLETALLGPWVRLWRRRAVPRFPWDRAATAVERCLEGPWLLLSRLNHIPHQCRRSLWEDARRAPWIWPWPPPAPPEPQVEPFVPPLDFDLKCALPKPIWSGVDFYLDYAACDRVLPHGWKPLITPGVIIVVHDLSIVTLPDGTPIPCVSVEVATDWDSWAWRWAAGISGQDASDLAHAATEVQLQIDEAIWKGIAESYDTGRQFGRLTTSIRGRSLSAFLADPWADPRARIESVDRLAVQLAEDEIYGTDWTLDWQTVDWLVPAGAFAYDAETPIGAIHIIAEAVGAMLQTHASQQSLIVAPRYKVPSWELDTTDPDVEIPEAAVISISTRFQPNVLHRGVWVAGRTQGVSVRVYRSGTDGSPYAPMVVDPLITHIDAARERGKQILSAGGRRAHVTLTMPLLPDIGVVTPGNIVAVGSGASRWKGYVMAVSISADRTRVLQTLTVDRPLDVP